MFEVVIENINEEFEVIYETERLDDAIEFAKKTPKETYKSIRIDMIGKDDKLIKIIELELK